MLQIRLLMTIFTLFATFCLELIFCFSKSVIVDKFIFLTIIDLTQTTHPITLRTLDSDHTPITFTITYTEYEIQTLPKRVISDYKNADWAKYRQYKQIQNLHIYRSSTKTKYPTPHKMTSSMAPLKQKNRLWARYQRTTNEQDRHQAIYNLRSLFKDI